MHIMSKQNQSDYTHSNGFLQNFNQLPSKLLEVFVAALVGVPCHRVVDSQAHQVRFKPNCLIFRDITLTFLQCSCIMRADTFLVSFTVQKVTLIFADIVFDIDTISLAMPMSFLRSWKATFILSSVAFCCSCKLRSMPMMPVLGLMRGSGLELLLSCWIKFFKIFLKVIK